MEAELVKAANAAQARNIVAQELISDIRVASQEDLVHYIGAGHTVKEG